MGICNGRGRSHNRLCPFTYHPWGLLLFSVRNVGWIWILLRPSTLWLYNLKLLHWRHIIQFRRTDLVTTKSSYFIPILRFNCWSTREYFAFVFITKYPFHFCIEPNLYSSLSALALLSLKTIPRRLLISTSNLCCSSIPSIRLSLIFLDSRTTID